MKRFTAPLAAIVEVFRNPQLRRLQLAWAGISFAMWAFVITLGVYAFGAGGAAAVGVAALVRLLPGALASPFSGLLGDRHSRRAVLVYSTLGSAVALALATVAVATGAPTWVVFAMAGLYTVFCTPYIPAEGALLPKLARTPQELAASNVSRSFMDSIGFLGGSLLAGILVVLTSIEVVFGLATAVALLSVVALLGIERDQRPEYEDGEDASGLLQEAVAGFRSLATDAPARLLGSGTVLLFFFEGAADVLIVVLALELLGLAESSVGLFNVAWAVGGLAGGAALVLLINRGQLVAGLVVGSLMIGAAMALPGIWAAPAAAALGWIGIGFGFAIFETASNTLLQRIGDDEILGRVRGALETARLLASAIGAIVASVLIGVFGVQGAALLLATILPAFAVLRWGRLRSFEIGAPVEEKHFNLLREDRVFAPLSLATLERLTHDLIEVELEAGVDVIAEGQTGDRFYLIESGRVQVFVEGQHRRYEGPGESFGEIALLRATPRTATVTTTESTRLLALDREHFIAAVTGHQRTSTAADDVIERRLDGPPEPHPEAAG